MTLLKQVIFKLFWIDGLPVEELIKSFLLADSLELAKKLEKYKSEMKLLWKLMSHKNHRPLGMSDAKIYNIDLGQEEYIASWIYQIMYQYGKGVFFVDSIVRGHVNFDQLDRIHEKFRGSARTLLHNCGGIRS